jgi:hypothetical protein
MIDIHGPPAGRPASRLLLSFADWFRGDNLRQRRLDVLRNRRNLVGNLFSLRSDLQCLRFGLARGQRVDNLRSHRIDRGKMYRRDNAADSKSDSERATRHRHQGWQIPRLIRRAFNTC